MTRAVLDSSKTFVDLLRRRAEADPDRLAYVFLRDGEVEEGRLTFGAIEAQARAIAARLQARNLRGERALMLYPSGLDFVAAFYGCLMAGVLPVPAYPPEPARPKRLLARIEAIVKDARPAVVLATSEIVAASKGWLAISPALAQRPWIVTNEIPVAEADGWRDPGLAGDDVAFLQYTSGSTSTPKGVCVTHANLVHNQRMQRISLEATPDERPVLVSWLPLFHDMGLIGIVLYAMSTGGPAVLMSPLSFLQQPLRWLRAFSQYRGTLTFAPTFGYELCVRKVAPEQRQGLDLSPWSVAIVAAEPVRAPVIERFVAAYQPHGFRREAIFPGYGLAEATLVVTVHKKPDALFVTRKLRAEDLAQHRLRDAAGDDAAITAVACGYPPPEVEIAIVDPETFERSADDAVGEIWLRGPSNARGYFERPEATVETFGAHVKGDDGGPFLRTGDLGFVRDGQLYITGRLKDLIIVRGRNYYPQDIELTAEESHRAVRPGCSAAFSVDGDGEERLVVVAEVAAGRQSGDALDDKALDAIIETIREAVAQEHELPAHAVVLLSPGQVPKTSSGKTQRRACRAAFEKNAFEALRVWRERPAAPPAEKAPAASHDLPKELAALPLEARPARVESWLCAEIAEMLRLPVAEVDRTARLDRLGADSLAAVELQEAIERELGIALPATTVAESEDVADLARAVAEAFNAASR